MERLAEWLACNVRWLKSQLARRGRTREEAEDLIQEAYLRVHEYCEHGGEAREPERVLVRTVMRLSMNYERDRRDHLHVRQRVEELALLDPGPAAEDVLAGQLALQRISGLLDSLEPRSRQAFLLHRVDGLTYAQIAKHMGISVSAVEKHIAWAMAVLLDAIGKEGELT